MRIIKGRETLKAESIKENKVFLYNAIKAVEMGATVDDLLHSINSVEDALKATQKELIEQLNRGNLATFREKYFYSELEKDKTKGSE